MGPHTETDPLGRAGAEGGTVNHAAKRVLMIGIVGAALLVGVVVGLAAGRGGAVTSVPEGTTTGALVDAAIGSPYRLSPPNEHDLGDNVSRISAREALASPATASPYRLSPPNEQDTEGRASAADPTTYRLSPPNETDPGP